jgi:glucose/arabinose dehydrogenase
MQFNRTRRTQRTGRPGVEALERRQLLTTLPTGFAETQVVTDLHSPVSMAIAPDGRIFLTEQAGKLRVVKNGQLLSTPFLSVTTPARVERGLIGVELDPNFASNGYVYTYYTGSTPNIHNRVTRWTAVDADPDPARYRPGDTAASGSEKVLYELDSAGDAAFHQGGSMHFGNDGKLYVAVGDHGGTVRAQSLSTQVGKILRLNPDGTIPTDNPFYTKTTGKNRAIWAYGLRNPFTFAIQRTTGRMFINDVGENSWEEINEGKAGANYGWPESEGPTTDPRFVGPIYAYHHDGSDAIVGGTFYNPVSGQFPSQYVGKYFFMDYTKRHMKVFDPASKSASLFADRIIGRAVDLDVGPDGSLYYLTRESEGVSLAGLYRIKYTGSAAPSIDVSPQSTTVSVGKPATFHVEATGSGTLGYQWQRQSPGASSFSNISGATGPSYTLSSPALSDSGAKFRVVVKNAAGTATSAAATLTVTSNRAPSAAVTSPAAGTLYSGGQSFTFTGSGTDPEDGSLPASAFTWEIEFHHADHVHPFVQPTTGSKSIAFTIPTTGEVSADVSYLIHLTVKDSKGLSDTVTYELKPRKATMTIAASVAGLKLTLDGQPFTSSQTVTGVTGIRRTLSAPASQTLNGTTYQFVSWSDGGAATHTISTPSSNKTYTATYRAAGGTTTRTLSATADAYVRDGTGVGWNYGPDKQLLAKTSASAGLNRYSYLKFDLSTLGATVGSAKLRLFGRMNETAGSSVVTGIYAAADTGWAESGLTWNNKPAFGSTALATARVTSDAARWYEWDLTDYLRQQKAAGKRFVTLVIKNTTSTRATVGFNSDEAGSNKPQLVVTG